MTRVVRRRFPHRVFGGGTEPDPRFTLANERTFLAWIRTALALLGLGVALEVLGLAIQPELRFAASLVMIGLGVLTPPMAWWSWGTTERAMRHGDALPGAFVGPFVGVGVAAVGLLILVGVVVT